MFREHPWERMVRHMTDYATFLCWLAALESGYLHTQYGILEQRIRTNRDLHLNPETDEILYAAYLGRIHQ